MRNATLAVVGLVGLLLLCGSGEDPKKGTRVRATVDMLSGHNQATEVTTLSTK